MYINRMTYSEMTLYLQKHSIAELCVLLGIPQTTLIKFLKNRSYVFEPSEIKIPPKKRIRINSLNLGIDSDFDNTATLTDLQHQIIMGSLMGDMYAGWTSSNSVYLRCEHCWGQINYLKVLYELLRPFSFSPYLDKPQKGLQDYQVGFSCHSSPLFVPFIKMFYTLDNGTKHLQKNILSEVIEAQTNISLAYWIMDDGKRYGSAFGIVVGKGPYYTRARIDDACYRLNIKFTSDFKVSEGKLGYLLYVTKGSSIIEKIRPYIIPDMAYKINLYPDDCGSFYKEFDWYKDWQKIKIKLDHPHLVQNPYNKIFYKTLSRDTKKRYDRSVSAQVRVRGFPYPSDDEHDFDYLFEKMKKDSVKLEDNILIYNHTYNAIANIFMCHRYKLRVRGRKSPYEVFFDNKDLKHVLSRQLIDGPALNNSNIRAALSTYKTQAVGQFNSLYAKYFCDKYCPEGGVVFDPCAGFGSRLLGCTASNKSYIGVDPSSETVEALYRFKDWLSYKSNTFIEIIKGCAEEIIIKKPCDFAITSPPYFNVEEYSYESTQSFVRYNTYEGWVEGFLGPMFRNVFLSLKPQAYFVLNIDDVGKYPLQKDALELIENSGFTLEKTFYSKALHRPASTMSSEPYFVLRRNK